MRITSDKLGNLELDKGPILGWNKFCIVVESSLENCSFVRRVEEDDISFLDVSLLTWWWWLLLDKVIMNMMQLPMLPYVMHDTE